MILVLFVKAVVHAGNEVMLVRTVILVLLVRTVKVVYSAGTVSKDSKDGSAGNVNGIGNSSREQYVSVRARVVIKPGTEK